MSNNHKHTAISKLSKIVQICFEVILNGGTGDLADISAPEGMECAQTPYLHRKYRTIREREFFPQSLVVGNMVCYNNEVKLRWGGKMTEASTSNGP